jgi:hypothetical protein
MQKSPHRRIFYRIVPELFTAHGQHPHRYSVILPDWSDLSGVCSYFRAYLGRCSARMTAMICSAF